MRGTCGTAMRDSHAGHAGFSSKIPACLAYAYTVTLPFRLMSKGASDGRERWCFCESAANGTMVVNLGDVSDIYLDEATFPKTLGRGERGYRKTKACGRHL
jgi:hypothetical protein